MNNNSAPFARYLPLLLIVLSVAALSCTPKGSKLSKKEDLINENFLFKKLVSNQLDAEWLSGSARISYNDGNQRLGFSGTIHARKDSLIWINVRKIGFEVARVLMTPDSVYVIDRFNNQYAIEPLDYLTRMLELPADFSIVQAILWGNPVFFGKGPYGWAKETDVYRLYNDNAPIKTNYWLHPEQFRLTKMSFDDPAAARKMLIEQGNFQPVNGSDYFSYFRKLQLTSEETGSIALELEFSQVEYNVPKEIRFEIPERYSRMR